MPFLILFSYVSTIFVCLSVVGGLQVYYCKWNLKNIILEGLFILRLMLRFHPVLAAKRNWMRVFTDPLR